MSCSAAAIGDTHRILLVDPGNFTTPYDLALASAVHAHGPQVQVVGQAGELLRCHSLYHGHFYPVLASRWGRLLPARSVRLVKGVCHGIDMHRLSRSVAKFGAGVVHLQWSPIPLIDCWMIRSLRRWVPVVLTLHDSNPYQGAASWLMRQGYHRLLRSFDAVIVHTQRAERRVAELGIDRALIHRIPHGLLGSGNDSSMVRARRRTPDDPLVLLQFGKIKPYKGIDLLLEALTLIPLELRRGLEVHIVGKPYMDTDSIEQFIRANDLAGCVKLRFEFISDAEAERLFAEADAILLPYREIDASGVAMSAVARGLPVLATAIDGFCELFEGESGARLVPAADPQALAGVIAEWTTKPAQLDELAEAMRLRRSRIPSWREIACQHLEVYAEARSRWSAVQEVKKGSLLTERRTP